MSIQDGRKLSSSALHDLRQRVVSAVEEKGMKAVDAMRVFGIGRTALFQWLKAYLLAGASVWFLAVAEGPRVIQN